MENFSDSGYEKVRWLQRITPGNKIQLCAVAAFKMIKLCDNPFG